MSKWLWKVAARKIAVRVAQLAISYAGAIGLSKFGITIDEKELTVGLFALLEGARDYLKLNQKGLWWL